jgi:ESF2/ABP1 family protein
MLNAQPIGGKKGNRWRDDVWTMKYLPRFKWGMLTEQIAQERAMHAARLRMELSQSKREQKHYLKQVEIGKSLEKREMKRKRQEQQAEDGSERSENKRIKLNGNGDANGDGDDNDKVKKKHKHRKDGSGKPSVTVSSSNPSNTDKSKYKDLDSVLGSIF